MRRREREPGLHCKRLMKHSGGSGILGALPSTKHHFLHSQHILLLYFCDQSCLALVVTTSSGLKPVLRPVSAGKRRYIPEERAFVVYIDRDRIVWLPTGFSKSIYLKTLLSVFDYKLGLASAQWK